MGDSTGGVRVVVGKSGSIAMRALLALVLMIGFYVMAIAVAAALLWLCYAIVAYGNRIPVKLLLLMFIGAMAILWSLVPRIDRFIPPGPRLLPEQQPDLFRQIEAIAAATGQAMPAEVYLERDVNAWVIQRGGIVGIGGRRVMGIGLALMRVLNIGELRAVLAHEFGHFHGGDTRLGPWVYKTRGAIIRTIVNLGDSLLQKPFLWYGKMFLRVTHAVSRQQEFTADRLAASVVGSEPLVRGLQKTHAAGMAFEPYWQNELVPVLSAGFRPPMADGFARFLESKSIATAVREVIDKEMNEQQSDPYDTHPPLRQRVAAVSDLPAWVEQPADAPAVSLLRDLPSLERDLLVAMAGPDVVGKLAEARWEDAGTSVYIPAWRNTVATMSQQLAGLTPESLHQSVVPTLRALGEMPPGEELQKRIVATGAALMLAAINAGAAMECEVGTPAAVVLGSTRVEPFGVLGAMARGELDPATWLAQCDALGITGVDLSSVGAADEA